MKPNEQQNDDGGSERVEHVYEFVIPARQFAERLDAFLTHSIMHATRTRVQKAIERQSVTVNGLPSKANYRIKPGDVIKVVVMRRPPLQLIPQPLPLEILFEDDDLIVVNKPAGMPTHPGIGNRDGTLVNAILWHVGHREPIDVLRRRESWADGEGKGAEGASGAEYADDMLPDENGQDDQRDDDELSEDESAIFGSSAIRPGIVHRLDIDTSGVMVVAKNYETTFGLAEQFAARTTSRQYVALVWGVVADDFRCIEGDIGRSPKDRRLMSIVRKGGKYAATEVTTLERYPFASLVACSLRTGRTHQIRVHLSHHRHSIIGDPDYGGREAALSALHTLYRREGERVLKLIHRQALHARTLGFRHPKTREWLEFTTELPEDMAAAVTLLRNLSST